MLYAIGLGMIGVCFGAQAVAYFTVARAAVVLKRDLGERMSNRWVTSLRSILPGRHWENGVSAEDVEKIQRFASAGRMALVVAVVPPVVCLVGMALLVGWE